jgi:hypothetical protein
VNLLGGTGVVNRIFCLWVLANSECQHFVHFDALFRRRRTALPAVRRIDSMQAVSADGTAREQVERRVMHAGVNLTRLI